MPGHGQEIARGGRYDQIGAVFGRARPATGFSADLKTLIALSADAPQPVRAILAPHTTDADLEGQVQILRRQGERVIYALPGQAGTLTELGCDRILEKQSSRWVVKKFDE